MSEREARTRENMRRMRFNDVERGFVHSLESRWGDLRNKKPYVVIESKGGTPRQAPELPDDVLDALATIRPMTLGVAVEALRETEWLGTEPDDAGTSLQARMAGFHLGDRPYSLVQEQTLKGERITEERILIIPILDTTPTS